MDSCIINFINFNNFPSLSSSSEDQKHGYSIITPSSAFLHLFFSLCNNFPGKGHFRGKRDSLKNGEFEAGHRRKACLTHLQVLQVNNSYNASAFPLAFSMIAVVFIFKKGGKDVDDHSQPRDFHLPVVNIQPIDHSVSFSITPIELDQNETSSQNPTSPLFNHCDVLSKNIEVLVPEYGDKRTIDLIVFTNYKDLYKELKIIFNIRLYFNKRPKSHWELIYEDDNGDMLLVGDDSWDEFYHNVRKLYLYKKKSLRNNFNVNPPQIMHDDVPPPPAALPAEQQTMMEPATAYGLHSSRLNDINMEAPSTLNLEPLPPGSVSLDQPEADSEEGLWQVTQADVSRPQNKPRLIKSDLILLVT